MRILLAVTFILSSALLVAQGPSPVTIRVARVIDGRGGFVNGNAVVSVKDGKIAAVNNTPGAVTYDLSSLTLLPGFIDTHVHIGWHFDAKGRYHAGPEPPDQAALYGAENAYTT